MGLLTILKGRLLSRSVSLSSITRERPPYLSGNGLQGALCVPLGHGEVESQRLLSSVFSLCGLTFMRRCKHQFERVLCEGPPPSPEPDASMLALCGYRLFKSLKVHAKGALSDRPPALQTHRQAGLPLNGRGIKGLTPLFREIRKRAVCSVSHSTKCHFHSLRACPPPFQKIVEHSANISRYFPPFFAGGKHSANLSKFTGHANGHMHSRVCARAYTYAHASCLRTKVLSTIVCEELNWSQRWRAALQKILARSHSNMQVFPSIAVLLKAVSLAGARAHIPWGLMAIVLGGHGIVRAHAQTLSYQSDYSSFLLSTLSSFFELCSIVARSLYLWILFMPAIITAPLANLFGGHFRQNWLQLVHCTLERAGAAFIKWGQWAATRPDLFPRDLCVELSKLHAHAPAHKFSYTVQTVERAFGKKIDDIFLEFEEKPVASGSIAQVHKATLRNGGALSKQKGSMTVAVKVRHPGVTDVIRRDFIIINWAANLSTFVPGLRWLRLDESVRQFAVFMLTQVDLSREAAHLSRFLYNFRSWKDVSFPRPAYPLVHPAVLVESYEQGESVSNYIEFSEKNPVNRKLAHIGTHTFLKMLLVDNFIHADMHPGNILVRLNKQVRKSEMDTSKTSRTRPQPHLVFLDVGLTAELSQKDRCNLLEFFKAVALRDGRTAAQCALEFSNNQSCPDPVGFIKELEKSFKFWGSREADIIHPGECMQELLEQVRRHRVNIDGNVCTVMVTIMVLEGWQRKLDPEFSIMKTLQKLLFKEDWAESLAYTINGIMAP